MVQGFHPSVAAGLGPGLPVLTPSVAAGLGPGLPGLDRAALLRGL